MTEVTCRCVEAKTSLSKFRNLFTSWHGATISALFCYHLFYFILFIMITVLLGVQIALTMISVLSVSNVFVNLLIFSCSFVFFLQKDLEQKLAEIEKRRLVSTLKQATQQ